MTILSSVCIYKNNLQQLQTDNRQTDTDAQTDRQTEMHRQTYAHTDRDA